MLSICADPQSLPLEILAKHVGEENQIAGLMLINANRKQFQLATQATQRLGSSTAINLQIDRPNTPLGHHLLLQKMVRQLRTLRPNVVVCHPEKDSATLSMEPLPNLVEKAIQMAADSLAFPEQINRLGLKTWQVNRLATLDATGEFAIDGDRLLPRSGTLVEDQIAISRALSDLPIINQTETRYRISSYDAGRVRSGDLFAGVRGEIPRRKESGKQGNLTVIHQASAKQKKFEQFVNFEANTPQDFLVWRKHIESFALPMESTTAGVWMMQLTERYLEKGKTELAAASANVLVTRWPDHAFAPAALTWLSQYFASREFGQIEIANRVKSGSIESSPSDVKQASLASKLQAAPQTVHQNGMSHVIWTPTETIKKNAKSKVQLAGHTEESIRARESFLEDRMRTAGHFLSKLSQRDPELMAGPQYRFLEAQISRAIHNDQDSEGRFRALAQLRKSDPASIQTGARRELEIAESTGQTSVQPGSISCYRTTQRPVLDGILDDAFWKEAARTSLIQKTNRLDGSNERSDIAIFAYDDQYLYAAFVCQKFDGQYYKNRKQSRPRDADLSHRDRVSFTIDLDRDYRSNNQFVVDHRGWVRESCSGCVGWNPEWFVSHSENEQSWTIELAIPLKELTLGSVEAGETWAIRIARLAFEDQNLWDDVEAGSGENLLNDQVTSVMKKNGANQQETTVGILAGLRSFPANFELFHFQAASPLASQSLQPE
jgi:hypothetical protein